MRSIPSMADTSVPGTQPFSRIVDSGRTSSWKAAVPAALLLVAIVVVIAWLAARASDSSQQLTNARNELAQQSQSTTQLQQRVTALDNEVARLHNPGRTTVILQVAAPTRRGVAQQESSSWAAATWGEQPDGKTWVRINAYGLAQPGQGKALALWLEPTKGEPVLVAKLDPAQDGGAFAEGKDLPAMDESKRLFVAIGDDDAKKPGQPLMQADLPKLKSTQAREPAQQGAQGKAETAQAKPESSPQGK
jgi:hypothetical protein